MLFSCTYIRRYSYQSWRFSCQTRLGYALDLRTLLEYEIYGVWPFFDRLTTQKYTFSLLRSKDFSIATTISKLLGHT
jgi:hypothetical protein